MNGAFSASEVLGAMAVQIFAAVQADRGDEVREMIPIRYLAVMILALQATAAAAQVGKLLPSDEADRNPELFAFRAQLQAAVARHDADAVLAVVDPNIKNTFGGDDGIEAFKRRWKLPSHDSALWDELGTVLALGGAFSEGSFVAPFLFERWPDRFDMFEHVLVLGTGVRVRAEPGTGGRVLTSLSFDIVPVAQKGPRPMTAEQSRQWTSVKLKDGRIGYVASRYTRSPIGYRAFFRKVNGQWRLTAFIAGD